MDAGLCVYLPSVQRMHAKHVVILFRYDDIQVFRCIFSISDFGGDHASEDAVFKYWYALISESVVCSKVNQHGYILYIVILSKTVKYIIYIDIL